MIVAGMVTARPCQGLARWWGAEGAGDAEGELGRQPG